MSTSVEIIGGIEFSKADIFDKLKPEGVANADFLNELCESICFSELTYVDHGETLIVGEVLIVTHNCGEYASKIGSYDVKAFKNIDEAAIKEKIKSLVNLEGDLEYFTAIS